MEYDVLYMRGVVRLHVPVWVLRNLVLFVYVGNRELSSSTLPHTCAA